MDGGQIGVGGFGQVFRATLLVPDVGPQKVALKVPRDHLRKSDARELVREMKHAIGAASGCNHVCPSLGMTVYDRRPGVLMRLYESSVLDVLEEEYDGGGMPVVVVLRIAWAVAAALLASHVRGIAHRDLKVRPRGLVFSMLRSMIQCKTHAQLVCRRRNLCVGFSNDDPVLSLACVAAPQHLVQRGR